jgi:hypothetical protein
MWSGSVTRGLAATICETVNRPKSRSVRMISVSVSPRLDPVQQPASKVGNHDDPHPPRVESGARPLVGQTRVVAEELQGLDQWLLEGDPAIRWRVLRDLEGASDKNWARERKRVATEGWGARLLAAQDDDGGWGGGIYSPKWTSTTYTLLHLLW